ncbi:outer membrane protein ImpK/VasF, OmpA/MotB domain [Vibrio sp. JCM 19052]|nr:outer membrane protein ImpK/VasF, OmpA/MotB domain [Vibrio sp. JCM 19052]
MPSQPKAVTPQAKTSTPETTSALVTSPAADSDWLVQLATFSNLKNAEKFIAQLPTSNYQPVADNINSYVRVIVRCDNSEQAKTINNWYRENANVNGLVVHNKNKQSEVESR